MIAYSDRVVEGAFDAHLGPGLTLCVEALVGEVGSDHMVKLEAQGVVTDDVYETISTYPLDKRFLSNSCQDTNPTEKSMEPNMSAAEI